MGVWAENWLISLNMILGFKSQSWMGFSLRKQPLNGSFTLSKHIASHIFGDPRGSNFPHRGAAKNHGFPQIPGNPKGALLELEPAVPRERKSYKPWSFLVDVDGMVDTSRRGGLKSLQGWKMVGMVVYFKV